jgi:hypothetical protein
MELPLQEVEGPVVKSIPLFDFANHSVPRWLEDIAGTAKEEPWGKKYKVLELFLRSNFEIAKQQGKVFEDDAKGIAFWKPGYLVSRTMDPIWIIYEKNTLKTKQKWLYKKVLTGKVPFGDIDPNDYQVRYEFEDFNPQWDIFIDQRNFNHIVNENANRLVKVFGGEMAKNSHLLFRTIYGEVMLAKKEAATIISQWYANEYQFLMPLYLTQSDKVELTAALSIDRTMKRYQLRTLLFPAYAYAYARSVVKSSSQLGAWITFPEQEINDSEEEDSDVPD